MQSFVTFWVFGLVLCKTVLGSADVIASGGGIVEEGKELVLKYEVGKEWYRCIWYTFATPETYDYCLFVSKRSNSVVQEEKCSAHGLTKSLTYTGKTKRECAITLDNVTDSTNRTWAVRVDEQMNVKTIEIIVAKPVDTVTMSAPPIVAGNSTSIQCKVIGGRPAPTVSYTFEPPREGLDAGSTQEQVADKDGIFTTDVDILLKPTADDDGRGVRCTAVILDGEKQVLFKQFSSEVWKLKVAYPPQPAKHQTLTAKEGEDLTVSFVISANPKPSEVIWKVLVPKAYKIPDDAAENQTILDTQFVVVKIPQGHLDDKYATTDLLAAKDENKFEATLTINNIVETDYKNQYQLVVVNSVGKRVYYFDVSAEEAKNNSTTPTTGSTPAPPEPTTPKPSASKMNTAEKVGIGILVAVLVIGVIVGLLIVCKNVNKNRNETAPLNR